MPRAIRFVALIAVVVGIAWAVRRALQDPAIRDLRVADLHLGWLTLACVAYSLGTLPGWLYWHRVLWAFGQRPTLFESLRAFQLGQLGKYVPGKGMVVVIRADGVRSSRTQVAPAAAAVFVETLTLMAVGATVAASILIFRAPPTSDAGMGRGALIALSLLLMAVAGIPTYPPLFRRLVTALRVDRADPAIRAAVLGLDGKVLATGWALNLIVWSLWGASLFAVLKGVPGIDPVIGDLPLIMACVALAMVAGFLSLIPGGLGVRELIILTLLAPFGAVKAVVAAVILRLAWLVSETVLATILYGVRPKPDHFEPADEGASRLDRSATGPGSPNS